MNPVHNLYAAKLFPSLIPNETDQTIFYYNFLGDELYVRFYPEAEIKTAEYLSSLYPLLEEYVQIPHLYACGHVETASGRYYYVSEKAVAGGPIVWDAENVQRVAHGLRRWHSVPTASFLNRIDRKFFDAKTGAFQSLTDGKTFERIRACYESIMDDDLFADYVVSHMDLSRANILSSSESSDLIWIDFEYTSLRPRAADIAQVSLFIFLQHLYEIIDPCGELDCDPYALLHFDAMDMTKQLLNSYKVPDQEEEQLRLTKWILLELLMNITFFLNTRYKKVRRLPPVIDKGANPHQARLIFETLMPVVEANLDSSEGLQVLVQARKQLMDSFIRPIHATAPLQNVN